MSRVYCGVCDRNVMDDCDCETIAANVWSAAKSAWTQVRATLPPTSHQKFLDAMFYAGEEVPSPSTPTNAQTGEDTCR